MAGAAVVVCEACVGGNGAVPKGGTDWPMGGGVGGRAMGVEEPMMISGGAIGLTGFGSGWDSGVLTTAGALNGGTSGITTGHGNALMVYLRSLP